MQTAASWPAKNQSIVSHILGSREVADKMKILNKAEIGKLVFALCFLLNSYT